MPMSDSYQQRLFPHLEKIASHYGTPFHIYDEAGLRETGENLKKAFAGIEGFREYFAVKALPNLRMMQIMREMDFGFDCSSIPELLMSRQIGARGDDIMFTSNNTDREEFLAAEADGGCILNLDDISLIPKVPEFPERICFRYNPGPRRTGNVIIGHPEEAKYGVTYDQIVEAYRQSMARGARRFGLHTMVASNERDYTYIVQTAVMLLELVEMIGRELDIRFDFVNIGGGLGIPYRPEDEPLNLQAIAREVTDLFAAFRARNGYAPRMLMESGRFITGPHGCLVTTAINHKDIYRRYIGVDACMSSLMRPALYEAYHHISVPGKEHLPKSEVYDVVGSLCENNDKFAVQRPLPPITEGDLLVMHDTGAHGHAMGFQYNGRLRPKELLLRTDGTVELIRRAETVADYLATQQFQENRMKI